MRLSKHLVAYVILALATVGGFYGLTQSNHDHLIKVQREDCDRVNEFRKRVNTQSDAFLAHNINALYVFEVLRDNDKIFGQLEPKQRKVIVKAIEHYYEIDQFYKHVPLTNCKREIR